jgi:hypothetical protein
MPYDDYEESTYDSEPVECYRFTHGARTWLQTSADEPIALPVGTFDPEVITRTEISFDHEDSTGIMDIFVDRRHPVAELFIGLPPGSPIAIVGYRAQREELTDYQVFFPAGRVHRLLPGSSSSEVGLRCGSIVHRLSMTLPRLGFHIPCNHLIYDDNCGVDESAFTEPINVTSISADGKTLYSNDFGFEGSGYLAGGKITHPDGEIRWIKSHLGSGTPPPGPRVTLIAPFTELESLTTVNAAPGCNRTEGHCHVKFNNLVNGNKGHLGFARTPRRNPVKGFR